ncbi:hypothetical protein Ga0074812_12568 [Parafrankia irregularis]|uniref:Uncharacterized protein n=1 Tax=Parafrankia irregularis TaxID=795642 RepID=A0A0S4QXL0_9ACTN|nr:MULTISPECIES: hypothetical protein [Frankiaceae]KPM50829.1 hypothetical protein ACG83_38060 [Frankia sp. R43]MBE3204837.1 hypothetical protein [Parafrankia sp. CH37]CUU59178.1 hypothetical protein Ga0074812_12568 [Parafrankia irregularis]
MKLTMILCDAAQVSEGKLYILGGGWNLIGPSPAPSALGILIEVPWDRANSPFTLQLELHDQDGAPAVQPGPAGPQPVRLEAIIEAGRTQDLAEGSPLQIPLAITLPPLTLTAGTRYRWEATMAGEPEHDGWNVSFQTRPAARPLTPETVGFDD